MSKVKISAENQTQRLNHIIKRVQELQSLDLKTLSTRPDVKSWSIIEVIGHMNSAYLLYEDRIDECLAVLPEKEHPESSFLAGRKSSLFIKLIAPQGNRRPMKMKTMKKFEPVFSRDQLNPNTIKAVFNQFFLYQNHLKNAIKQSRSKDLRQTKLVSAIGPLVKFYLPEAFEFLISHQERHLVQIDGVLDLVSSEALAEKN